MRVLVVGGGGREHALCWKLKQDAPGLELFCAPGNPGIARLGDCAAIAPEEIHKLADFATELKIDLTVVGPELPLALGIVDEFQNRELTIFGPRRAAAQLESSKVFAKEFMLRHGIPTAEFEVVYETAEGLAAAERLGFPLVLKADGLASGKGVLIVHEAAELQPALAAFFEERRFGNSGDRVLVEPFLQGEEVSLMGLCDGKRVLPLATAKDYKRIGEDDTGPNTGGMGSHTPAGILSGEQASQIISQVLHPTVAGMAAEESPFVGVLYAGLMMTEEGPRVLEFNTRFGDPEVQSVLLRMEDSLLDVLHDGARGEFQSDRLHFKKAAAACIVLASAGYPDRPRRGEPIEGLEAAAGHPDVEVFHAGTAEQDGRIVTAGGRVLNVCATGAELREALKKAYAAAAEIRWPSKLLRSDIGRRVLRAGPIAPQTGSYSVGEIKQMTPPDDDDDDGQG